jgi:hypothetical protein
VREAACQGQWCGQQGPPSGWWPWSKRANGLHRPAIGAYDNWDTLYCVDALTEGRAETGTARTMAELLHQLCNQHCQACPVKELERDGSYYVTISA